MSGDTAMCRTCTTQVGLLPLFARTGRRRRERALRLATGIQIKVNDGLPQSICIDCSNMLESCITFRTQSRNAHHKLLALQSQYTFNEAEHALVIRSEADSAEILEAKSDLKLVSREIKSEDDHDFEIDSNQCASSDENHQTLNRNLKRRPYLDLIDGPVEKKGPVKCKLCQKISKTMNAFIQHSKSHLGYEILCEYCARRCISRAQLVRHQRARHGLERDDTFACTHCEYRALDKEQLTTHERREHTRERPFVCAACGEAFYTRRVLLQHSVTHSDEKPYECPVCRVRFKLRSMLHAHRSVHARRYVYACYVCRKSFNKPYAARRHLTRVHGVPRAQLERVSRVDLHAHRTHGDPRLQHDRPSGN